MLLETLKIFCDVVDYNSFSAGAKENSITQSRATQSVKKLESELGAVLIDRSSRPLKPTEVGVFCKTEFQKMLDIYSSLEKKIKRSVLDKELKVIAGCIYSVGFTYMANIKDEFEKVYPDNVLDLLYLHPNEIIKQLYDGSLDFGVISFPTLNLSKEQLLEVDIIPWKDEEMVLVAPTDHPLSSIDSVSTKQLNGLDLISFDSNLNIAHTISDFLDQNGVVMRLKQRFDNVEAIKRAVESGEGVAILPAPTLNREVELGILKAIPFVDASIIRPLGIIYKKGQLVNNAMQHFIELLMEI